MLLAVLRPNVHCPHVGPTGGMKCVDKSEDKWFLDFGCPACGEGLRATFSHEPVHPGPFGTGVVCALAVP